MVHLVGAERALGSSYSFIILSQNGRRWQEPEISQKGQFPKFMPQQQRAADLL
jgi:hypothetical protein